VGRGRYTNTGLHLIDTVTSGALNCRLSLREGLLDLGVGPHYGATIAVQSSTCGQSASSNSREPRHFKETVARKDDKPQRRDRAEAEEISVFSPERIQEGIFARRSRGRDSISPKQSRQVRKSQDHRGYTKPTVLPTAQVTAHC
jgi:hypothetical protein